MYEYKFVEVPIGRSLIGKTIHPLKLVKKLL